jgi:putative SOS response-associated peptidase YedK
MCHHFVISAQAPETLAGEFNARAHPEVTLQTDYYPLARIPVIRLDDSGQREMVPMEWGFLPHWWKPTAKASSRQAFQRKCFNARSETAHEKPSFRTPFRSRRALVPATEFMEKGRYFSLRDRKPFTLAALWERWQAGDQWIESCTILTTISNALVQAAGHHRMPVLLATETTRAEWLDPEKTGRGELEHLLRPHNPATMEWRPAVKAVEEEQ